MYPEYTLKFVQKFGVQYAEDCEFLGYRRREENPPPRNLNSRRIYIRDYRVLRCFEDPFNPLTELAAYEALRYGGPMMGMVLATQEFLEYRGGIIRDRGNAGDDVPPSVAIVGMDREIQCFKIQSSSFNWGDPAEGESVGWILYNLVYDILQPVLAYPYPVIPYRWGSTSPRSMLAKDGSGHSSVRGSRGGLGGIGQRLVQEGWGGNGEGSSQGRRGKRHGDQGLEGEVDCPFYLKTGSCKYGATCRYNHPDIYATNPPAGAAAIATTSAAHLNFGVVNPAASMIKSIDPRLNQSMVPLAVTSEAPPERPGEPDCPYFIKTQKSKFGPRCKFNHPKERTLGVAENADPSQLPQWPSEPPCVFYTKTGNCKFGASCKFRHPKDIVNPLSGQVNGMGNEAFKKGSVMPVQPVAAPASLNNSKGLPVRPGEVDCPFYLKTGSCKYGATCRYNHPDIYATNPPAGAAAFATTSAAHLNFGVVNPAASMIKSIDPRLNQSMLGLGPAIYPQRPGQIECDFYMKSGECKFGERCKFQYPINQFAHTQLAKESQQENVKLTLAGLPRREIEGELTYHERVAAVLREIETEIVYEKQRKDSAPPVIAANIFSGKTMYFLAEVPLAVTSEAPPERPGEPDCPYFIKTQKSKLGPRCKFDHPKERTLGVAENADPSQLPQRPSEPPCVFYTKTGNCKFGASCKFHHPNDVVISLSGQVNGTGNEEAFKNGSVMPVQPIAAPASLHNSKGLPVRPL